MFTSFDNEITLFLKSNHSHPIMVSESTASCLTNAGCPDLPMYIGNLHLKNILAKFDDEGSHHEIDQATLAKIPEALENPVFIIDSASREDSVVVCVDLFDKFDQPIFVTIHVNGSITENGKKHGCNFVTSIYGKRPDGFAGTFYRAVKEGRVVYLDKDKFQTVKTKLAVSFASKMLKDIVDCHSYESSNAKKTVKYKKHFDSKQKTSGRSTRNYNYGKNYNHYSRV